MPADRDKAVWIEDGVPGDATDAIVEMSSVIGDAVRSLRGHGWSAEQVLSAVTGAAAAAVGAALEATDAR